MFLKKILQYRSIHIFQCYICIVHISKYAHLYSSITALKNWWGWPVVGSPLSQRSKWRPMHCCWLSGETVKKPRDGVRGCCCCCLSLCHNSSNNVTFPPPKQHAGFFFSFQGTFLWHTIIFTILIHFRQVEKYAVELTAFTIFEMYINLCACEFIYFIFSYLLLASFTNRIYLKKMALLRLC